MIIVHSPRQQYYNESCGLMIVLPDYSSAMHSIEYTAIYQTKQQRIQPQAASRPIYSLPNHAGCLPQPGLTSRTSPMEVYTNRVELLLSFYIDLAGE